MASTTDHPFVNPVRLPSLTSRVHARKPSRSPVRHDLHESDSLLRDLSPTSTLRAFLTDPSDMGPSADLLVTSIRSATMSERCLGAKAAQTCLDLRNWTREIEHWQWPGTFEQPRKRGQLKQSIGPGSTNGNDIEEDEEYWGSLPARLVQEYERRADEIGQALDDIDVEELKDYALTSHYRLNSRPLFREDGTGEYSSTATDYRKLDDFTALVTATILQALPFLSRLNQLLDTWTIRLIILRGAPCFLDDLERVHTGLDNCWAAINPTADNDLVADGVESTTRASMQILKVNIENQLGALGRRLDRFLDALEGRNECVPDSWIDDFDSCESNYSRWVVQAERTAIQDECGRQLQMPTASITSAADSGAFIARKGLLSVSETEDPASDDDAVRRPSQSLRSSVDVAQLAQSPLFPSPVASRQAGLTELDASGPWTKSNRAVSAPLSIASHSPSGHPGEHASEGQTAPAVSGIERSASTKSSSKEEATSSVAARRAAFLRDIERNQSLNKSTLSPVRPFERASNAFTRLFKKEKSPEQVGPKRTGSRLAEGRTSSTERDVLSPASFASSRFSSIIPTISTQSAANSSKSSADDVNDTKPGVSSRKRNDSSSRIDEHDRQDISLEVHPSGEALGLTSKSSGSLSSPFHSPDKEVFAEQRPPDRSDAEEQPSTPICARRRSNDELETPSMPIDTDVFHRTFIEGFPGSDDQKLEVTRAFAAHRRASLPRSHRLSSGDVPPSSKDLVWAPTARTERHASASAARPRTAPSCAFSRATENATVLHHARDFCVEALQASPMQLKRAGCLPLMVPNDTETSDVETNSKFRVKRASVASIEAYSRSELRSIDVPKNSRQNSVSSRRSPSSTPVGHSRTPSGSQQQERVSPDHGIAPEITRSSPVLEHTPVSPESSSAPLNIVMKKLRGRETANQRENMGPNSSGTRLSSPLPSAVHADQFDRHVSEVLENLPAPIRFKSRAGAETPVSRIRGYSGTKTSSMRVSPKGGDMTIAPAESSPKKSRTAADSEVKLYHLTHTGREDPIKLFVRLVGEGERVMVRVGGGWADLADYLRDFANHHGSRTVSEGNLEVAALPTAPLSTRKLSNPAEYQRAKTPTTPREGRPVSSDDDMTLKRRPFDVRESAASISNTPNNAGIITSFTPKSSESGSSNSRPSTAGNSRPSSRQAQLSSAADVGLSGPSSAAKRAELPAEKARWVEGMISRAKKSASAEKSKEDKEKYFNELSKAGGTRRVIFRSGNGKGPLADRTNNLK